MFLKPANSENGKWHLKKSKMSPEKNHVQRKLENWKSEKLNVFFHFKKSRFFKTKKLHFLAARGQTHPPSGIYN